MIDAFQMPLHDEAVSLIGSAGKGQVKRFGELPNRFV
jgi:hypothetical protein